MKKKVLWIEDGVTFDAQKFVGPVIHSRKYDLTTVITISDAIRKIQKEEFDIIIFDIRMQPGDIPEWEKLYQDMKQPALRRERLGLILLYCFLRPDLEKEIELNEKYSWVKPGMIGIFSVEKEEELSEHMQKWGITFYRNKNAKTPITTLLKLIDEIVGKGIENNLK
ncbi:MAG: hypothetical protein GY855_08330 [candidate division Zixibacteria bacterium]|nr:hypothetical protein [candidate division Zixibacteria bacterium]